MGDARECKNIPDNSFDISVSFGVFVYFDSLDEVSAQDVASSSD